MAKARKGDAKRQSSKKSTARAATEPQKVVRQLTTEKEFNSLLRACKGHESNISEYVGSLREKIGHAVEKQNLHKKAFSVYRALDRLEADKLSAFFDHFDHYCDVPQRDNRGNELPSLRQRADSAPSLDLGDKPGEEDGEGEDAPETGDGKVTSIKGGRRKPIGEMMREPGGALAGEAPAPKTTEQAAVG